MLCRPFINFSVATFLFLSGYLTKSKNANRYAFYKKRIIRVIVPYVIWTILYSLPSIINYGGKTLLINLLTAKASVPLYYIFVYIQFVILTPYLCKLVQSKYKFIGLVIAPISVIIFKYYELYSGIEFNEYIKLFWSDCCLGWFTFYYLGLLLGNNLIRQRLSLKTLSTFYFLSILLQIAEGYYWYSLGEINCGTQLKLTSILTSSLFCLIIYGIIQNKITLKNKFLRLLSDYSFGIYLCHMMIIKLLSLCAYYSMIPYPINSAIVIVISWGCCYIMNLICSNKLSYCFGFK